jgi:hypothetical protein
VEVELRRIIRNIRDRQYIDAYVISFVAIAFAATSIFGDALPVNWRWAALLGGVGLLVFQITLPDERADLILHDRSSFDQGLLIERLADAQELWVFAPTAVNVLSAQNCDRLRGSILSRSDGVVKIVVLNPEKEPAVDIAARQLDGYIDYPVQDVRSALRATLGQLERMCSWDVPGRLEYRVFHFNPGFSLVIVDPHLKSAFLIVEFHALHNVSTSDRMHLELTPSAGGRWFSYWSCQFSSIWEAAAPVPVRW